MIEKTTGGSLGIGGQRSHTIALFSYRSRILSARLIPSPPGDETLPHPSCPCFLFCCCCRRRLLYLDSHRALFRLTAPASLSHGRLYVCVS